MYRLSHLLGNPKSNAMISALASLSMYASWAIIGFLSAIGILYDNAISQTITDHLLVSIFGFAILTIIVFGIRYYKFYDLELVVDKIKEISGVKKKIYVYTINFLYIAIPILSFIFVRIYAFNSIF